MMIVYEGIDGSGKTTSSTSLSQMLYKEGFSNVVVHWSSFMGYEGENEDGLFYSARNHRKTGKLGALSYSLWHCADFAYRWETLVLPNLLKQKIIILDRYKYTAFVRDVLRGLNRDYVEGLYSFAPAPDLLIYLDIDPQEAFERKRTSQVELGYYEVGKDIFPEIEERTGFLAFQALCRRHYEKVLPEHLTLKLDSAQSKEKLQSAISEVVLNHLRKNFNKPKV